jgi:uncharacterized protein (DUF486 family)
MKHILVPLMIFLSGAFMAVAWLGHLRIKEYGFWVALALSWAIVLPEYVLNVAATRYGHGLFTGAQMGTFHLCSGVICVALVSRFILGETIRSHQMLGMLVLVVGMTLILWNTDAKPTKRPATIATSEFAQLDGQVLRSDIDANGTQPSVSERH